MTTTQQVWYKFERNELFVVMGAMSLLLAMAMFSLPMARDWENSIRPAVWRLWQGASPYGTGFYGPPWALVLLSPFAFMPLKLGRGLLFVCSLMALGYTLYKRGRGAVAIFYLFSPPVISSLWFGNLEAFTLLGLVLPPRIGLFFLALKPQVGIGVALLWLVRAWREGGMKEVVRVFAPVSVALGLSFVMFGLWPLHAGELTEVFWNTSFFPYTLPVGLLALVQMVRHDSEDWGLLIGPMFSPYLAFYSWAGPLMGLVGQPLEMLVAVSGVWLIGVLK